MDKEMAEKAIRGDEDAFLELMQLHKAALYKTALTYLRNEQEAIEAVQEVTFRVYTKISAVRNPDYLKTWMIRIMINYCNDVLKRRKRFGANPELLEAIPSLDNFRNIEILDALDVLDEQGKELVIMKFFHDMKMKDIAFMLKKPEGTIKTRLHKAMRKLRAHIEEEKGVEGHDEKRRNKA